MSQGFIDQLLQLFNGVRRDGDLLAKPHMKELMKAGLAEKYEGFNLITVKGVMYLYDLGFVKYQRLQEFVDKN